MYIYIGAYIDTYTYIHTHTYKTAYIPTRMCIHTHSIYIYTYYTHTHIYVEMPWGRTWIASITLSWQTSTDSMVTSYRASLATEASYRKMQLAHASKELLSLALQRHRTSKSYPISG